MLILFMGPTASGKTTLMNSLCNSYTGFDPVIRVTTREMRETEINGKDYDFVSVTEFNTMQQAGEFAEIEEYSGKRFYGTKKQSLIKPSDPKSIWRSNCLTITPSGLLQICSSGEDYGKILLVYCECSLATQIIRYVSRKNDFNINDKMEMCDRLARDEGMFKGVDAVINSAEKIYCNEFYKLNVNTESALDTYLPSIKQFVDNVNKVF